MDKKFLIPVSLALAFGGLITYATAKTNQDLFVQAIDSEVAAPALTQAAQVDVSPSVVSASSFSGKQLMPSPEPVVETSLPSVAESPTGENVESSVPEVIPLIPVAPANSSPPLEEEGADQDIVQVEVAPVQYEEFDEDSEEDESFEERD